MLNTTSTWLTAAESLADLVVKTGWAGVVTENLPVETETQIVQAAHQYVQNYRHLYGELKVLGMPKPVSLESVYTTVQFLDSSDIRSFESVEALEAHYRRTRQRNLGDSKRQRRAGIDVVNQEKRLTVLGGPGVGKSTFLRKIGLDALKGRLGEFKHACIPIFIELKHFDHIQVDIQYLTIEKFRACGFPSPEVFVAQALERGRLLFLLDGLDEVPTQNLTHSIRTIRDFMGRYRQNRFIASCRSAAYHSYFQSTTDVTISEFSHSQISQFIVNWFQSDLDKQRDTATSCWNLLRRPGNEAALDLAKTPLLLVFLCLVYDRSQNLPENRSILYRRALDILLEEWAAEKRIQRDEIYQGLHTHLEKALLSELAYAKFKRDRLFFSKQEVISQIAYFLSETLHAPEHLDGQSVLTAIEVQQGILVERADNIYSFSHLTIQEFLTARCVFNNQRLLIDLIDNHLSDNRWREVFLLVAGLQDSANELLLQMGQRILNYINTPRLLSLVRSLEQVTDKMEVAYIRPVQRALLLYFVFDRGTIFAPYYDFTVACDLAFKLIIDLSSPYKFDFIVNYDCNFAYERKRAREYMLGITARASRDRDRSTVYNCVNSLSKQEFQVMLNYLTAMLVLLQCKKSAVRVSPTVWQKIEASFLSVGR